jgi:uncharacterized glyoxalase superfamily protein PhnB
MSLVPPPRLKQLTPVLVVDEVAHCLIFWTERFGFVVENEVLGPDGRPQFASVKKDDIEIMYQTKASVLVDRPEATVELQGHSTALFITTDDLDSVERSLHGSEIVTPRHTTFYGSEEIYAREPGGNLVGFAQFG